VALAVLLVSTGAIVVSGNVSSNGFTFSVSRPVLLLIGLAASAYLETLVGVRTYAEWKLFRLKNAVAEQQLDQMRQIFQAGLLEPLRISTFIGKDGQIHPEQHYIGGDERQAEFARKAKIWFHSQYVSLIGARRGKFIVEICFPILAGLAAMSSCIWALTHRL
jgi:type II secretory pathway pseudopilin PulG